VRRADWALLGTALVARALLGALRFAGDPERFVNREEAHNATAAWLFAHGHLLGDVMRVQYRSFCGGCSVVALAGAPFFALSDALWAWKLLALGWTAAIQLAGFAALRAAVNPAAGWAWLLLGLAPTPGGLDLSLMLWGNHQESALPVLLALWAQARGRAFAAGLGLGFALFFARTSAYAALVLVPLAFAGGRRAAAPTLAGLAVGAAPLLLPAADGDAGWYRFADAVLPTLEKAADRAGTLLLPHDFGVRAFLPLPHPDRLGSAWLAAAAASAVALVLWRRGRRVVALALAWVFAYTFTSFPIFLVNPRVPVNNVRYHAPWLFLLTLLVAAGAGVAWGRGRRVAAGAVVAALVLVDAGALLQVMSRPAPGWRDLPAPDPAGFVTTVAGRFPDVVSLGEPGAAADQPARLVARLRGLTLARRGAPPPAEGDGDALAGYGEALVEPCAPADAIRRALAPVPTPRLGQVGRGVALTLSFCRERTGEPAHLGDDLSPEHQLAVASLEGHALVDACGGPDHADVGALATCVGRGLQGVEPPRAVEITFGAGRAWGGGRGRATPPAAFLDALGLSPELRAAAAEGVAHVAAGSRQPALARERSGMRAPGVGPRVSE
jgi:hypothetical protein